MKMLGQFNKVFAKLQEMTNKQVEKYSTLAYLLRTLTLNRGIRANKSRIKCANKGKKHTHKKKHTV